LTRTSPEQFDAQVDLNLKAVFLGCVAAAKAMDEKGGVIVNISSSASRGGNIKNGPYGASKAAVNNLTNSFANEMAPKIRVNGVAPGPIATQNFIDSMNMTTPEREAELKAMMKLPMDRFGTPEDIGAAVLFMASDASSWMTGQTIFVTGGS
jgi:7-alpha-hydroxysteroid dehydrogenase